MKETEAKRIVQRIKRGGVEEDETGRERRKEYETDRERGGDGRKGHSTPLRKIGDPRERKSKTRRDAALRSMANCLPYLRQKVGLGQGLGAA